MRHLLCVVVSLVLLGACPGDVNPGPNTDGSPPAGDQQVARDQTAGPDGAAACNEGDKRCGGLYSIEECKNGAWVETVDCKAKKIGGQECTCSITMLYVCSVGPNECT